MPLSPEDAKLVYKLLWSLYASVNQETKTVPGPVSASTLPKLPSPNSRGSTPKRRLTSS